MQRIPQYTTYKASHRAASSENSLQINSLSNSLIIFCHESNPQLSRSINNFIFIDEMCFSLDVQSVSVTDQQQESLELTTTNGALANARGRTECLLSGECEDESLTSAQTLLDLPTAQCQHSHMDHWFYSVSPGEKQARKIEVQTLYQSNKNLLGLYGLVVNCYHSHIFENR